jgi:hypothetical protein
MGNHIDMKEVLKKIKTLIAFDTPLELSNIRNQFASRHLTLEKEMPGWSTAATRQKLISEYWFTYVVQHFAFIYGSSSLLTFVFRGEFKYSGYFVLSILIAGLICFPVLYFFHYRPYFDSIFLPRLETIKENYERRELERLEKCRKDQLPNPTLILIHYVIDKAGGMDAMQANDKFAGLLVKLYGVDPRSLKKSMDIFFGSSINRKSLKERGRTEIQNRFNEAYRFFEELEYLKGIKLLQELETKVVGAPIGK